MAQNPTKPSITFTVLIFFGLILVLLGVVVVLLGLGNGSAFSFKFEKVELSTSSSGLAIIAIGALLSGYVATRLPANVMVFGLEKPSLLDRVQSLAPQLLLGGVIAVAVLLVILVREHALG